MVAAVGPVQRNVIVVTVDLKKGSMMIYKNYLNQMQVLKQRETMKDVIMLKDFLMKKGKYVVIQHWDSFEQYNAYADWRFNEDPSGLVGKMLPLISGGADGISIYSNNTGYGFY